VTVKELVPLAGIVVMEPVLDEFAPILNVPGYIWFESVRVTE
jgi:hypothetical protein